MMPEKTDISVEMVASLTNTHSVFSFFGGTTSGGAALRRRFEMNFGGAAFALASASALAAFFSSSVKARVWPARATRPSPIPRRCVG